MPPPCSRRWHREIRVSHSLDKGCYRNGTVVSVRSPYSQALGTQGWDEWGQHAYPRKPIAISTTAPNKFHQEMGRWGGEKDVVGRISYKKSREKDAGALLKNFQE